MNQQIYIHYGATEFDPEKGFPIENNKGWIKPKGGLWASRINATRGWKDWCEVEDFRECTEKLSFKFTIKNGSNIVTIKSLEDLEKLPVQEGSRWSKDTPWRSYIIDFEKCIDQGIDAVELCIYGDEYDCDDYFELHNSLYGWDCDSIVILNPNAVIPVSDTEGMTA